ncbi:MAG: hypothetical protein N2V78_04805 [Methanophagales archaeon]|nr:hypothetical protein [Methanophagales archaeon]
MMEVASLRNFDLFQSSYSIFDSLGDQEIGTNYSFEFMDIHDYVIVFYTMDGKFKVKDREELLTVYLPLKVMDDRGTHILTYGVTTFFIGEKRFFEGEEEISKIFRRMMKNFREEVEAMEFLTPAILSELVENRISGVNLLSAAYVHMISYAAWWILNSGMQNEWWDIRRLAEVLKGFKKPDIGGVDRSAKSFLREIDAMNVSEYCEGLNSLRRLYAIKEDPENKKLATAVAFDALMKLYKVCENYEQ